MKVEDYSQDGSRERRIVADMVVSDEVLARVAGQWNDKPLLGSPVAGLVGGWCCDYFKEHGKAPGRKVVEDIFREAVEGGMDSTRQQEVESFLAGVDYPDPAEINSGHSIKRANKQFWKVNAKRHIDELQAAVDRSRMEEFNAKAGSFHHAGLEISEGFCPFNSESDRRLVFSREHQESLVPYDGDLGRFFANQLVPDRFVSFCAPEKGMKSFFLLDAAFRLLENRKRVAFFDCGDQNKEDLGERLYARAAEHPWNSDDGQWPVTIRIPTGIVFSGGDDEDDDVHCSYRRETFDKRLSDPVSADAIKRFQERIKSRKTLFRSYHYPAGTATIPSIRNVLKSWETSLNWVPHCVIIDYADLVTSANARLEGRDIINDVWINLNRMSQEMPCLVLTATQVRRDAADSGLIRPKHMADDKRKLAHVDAMVGINTTPKEKDRGICRLAHVNNRRGPEKLVYVAGCLAIAKPAILSSFKKRKKEKRQ